jgi:hypothetical protein
MKKQKCKKCGCTTERACEGGCYWFALDLCSRCALPGMGDTFDRIDRHKKPNRFREGARK